MDKIRRVRDTPSFDYSSKQFVDSVTLVLGLLDLSGDVHYRAKVIMIRIDDAAAMLYVYRNFPVLIRLLW